ncbi:MAG: hypothetical protein QOI21_4639 [Actinomycetota bacterium]|nr:hypothetical protein [Actinomycetota bacterium]
MPIAAQGAETPAAPSFLTAVFPAGYGRLITDLVRRALPDARATRTYTG